MIVAINLAGLGLIGFIIWWFWLSTPSAVKVEENIVEVLVENGTYTPARIEAVRGQSLILRFIRKDASPCAEKVEFDSLNLSVDLPVNESCDIKIPTKQAGEFDFTCQMKMYRGKLIIK